LIQFGAFEFLFAVKGSGLSEEEVYRRRVERVARLREAGIEPYGFRFLEGRLVVSEVRGLIDAGREEEVRVAGRVYALRLHGKTTFLDIGDQSGKLQLCVVRDVVGQQPYKLVKKLDAGDILGAEGKCGRTRTGEPTVFVERFWLLSKALLPPPEKWHGLRDVELRYRRRYVDLFANPDVRDKFILRSRIVWEVRRILQEQGYIEVETPIMQPLPGGAEAKPFVTHHNALDCDLFLRIAPELYLKRLLVGGLERVFEVGRVFRNEGLSPRHNPEFTMLEAYLAFGDYTDMMRLTEKVLSEVAQQVLGSTKVTYKGRELDFEPPFERVGYTELFRQKFGFDVWDEEKVRKAAERYEIEADWHWDRVDKLFDVVAEEELWGPLFVLDHPVEMSPLAKRKKNDRRLVERFELFVGGMEVANAFTELNDPEEQRVRFEEQARRTGGRVDRDFLRALAYAMPPAGGLGIGIDRLVMILLDLPTIRDAILFPTLRPKE